MEEKLNIILQKLEEIEKRLYKIENSTNNMDQHISFVEYVINKIKSTSIFPKEILKLISF